MTSERPFVDKSWGFEDWVANSPLYCCKRIFVRAGERCSWHYHKEKTETFLVVEGTMQIRYVYPEEREKLLALGCSEQDVYRHAGVKTLFPWFCFHLPVGTLHQFEGLTDCTFVEASTEHFDSDTYRVDYHKGALLHACQ